MSGVLTTFLVVFAALPGIASFFGFYSPSRYGRDTLSGNALGDLALTLFVTVVLHVVAISLLDLVEPWLTGLTLAERLVALSSGAGAFSTEWTVSAFGHAKFILVYTVVLTSAGYLAGRAIGWLVVRGPLRFLARHRWIYDLIEARQANRGFVVAYVLSHIKEGEKIIMYRGHLEEFYFAPDGSIAYLILKNCYRYYMQLEDGLPKTTHSEKVWPLLPQKHNADSTDAYYMMIEGKEIANVVFERTRGVERTSAGERALEEALRDLEEKPAAGAAEARQATEKDL